MPPANRSYAQELARNVDAFFPSMNTFDTIRRHGLRAPTEATEDGRLAAGKPVFFTSGRNTATVPHELGCRHLGRPLGRARDGWFESISLQRRVTRTSNHFGPARGSKWVTAGPSAADDLPGGDILAGFRPI